MLRQYQYAGLPFELTKKEPRVITQNEVLPKLLSCIAFEVLLPQHGDKQKSFHLAFNQKTAFKVFFWFFLDIASKIRTFPQMLLKIKTIFYHY